MVVYKLKSLRDKYSSYPLFVNWVGFKRTDIEIEHAKREEGKSSYTFQKLFDLAIDSIVSQSNKPLKVSIKVGCITSALSFLYATWLFIRYFLYSVHVTGWTSVMVSIYFIAGLIFANMGILGLYIGKTFEETKQRPLYIIQEVVNFKKGDNK